MKYKKERYDNPHYILPVWDGYGLKDRSSVVAWVGQ